MAKQDIPRIRGAETTGSGTATETGEQATSAVAPAKGVDSLAPAASGTPTRPGRRKGLPRSGATGTAGTKNAPAPQAPATAAIPGRCQGVSHPNAVISPKPVAGNAPSQPVSTTNGLASSATPASGRSGRKRLLRAAVLTGALLTVCAIFVLVARWLVTLEPVQSFVARYPGESELPHDSPVGLPAWLAWQHFFNAFLMVLIIRSGWQVRTQRRPPASWSPRWGASTKKISITLWFHQSLDILWLANGALFVVLLMVTGQWMRVVPTSWETIPNALSAALQYASLDWPTENGWVNYNSLQVLAYFVTIFIAAPLAAATGFRMSEMWPAKAQRLSRAFSIELARAIHFPVMLYFVGFIIVHVALVLSTGALRNLNHMYGAQDAVNWVGFWIFFASILVILVGWAAARPLVLAPIASLFGRVGR